MKGPTKDEKVQADGLLGGSSSKTLNAKAYKSRIALGLSGAVDLRFRAWGFHIQHAFAATMAVPVNPLGSRLHLLELLVLLPGLHLLRHFLQLAACKPFPPPCAPQVLGDPFDRGGGGCCSDKKRGTTRGAGGVFSKMENNNPPPTPLSKGVWVLENLAIDHGVATASKANRRHLPAQVQSPSIRPIRA